MRKLLQIVVVGAIIPCCGCRVGEILFETILNSVFDTDGELPDHATEGMSSSERARANAELNNVVSLGD